MDSDFTDEADQSKLLAAPLDRHRQLLQFAFGVMPTREDYLRGAALEGLHLIEIGASEKAVKNQLLDALNRLGYSGQLATAILQAAEWINLGLREEATAILQHAIQPKQNPN